MSSTTPISAQQGTATALSSDAPFLLLILDGFGYREEEQYNAIAQAHTPNLNALWRTAPHTLLDCSGKAVGLPDGQMGNSEVGHMNIGAGRIVYQELTRINCEIENGGFFQHPLLAQAMADAKSHNRTVHIIGLLSPGGIHSHEQHIHALVSHLANNGVNNFYVHALLDGRDSPPQSATTSLTALQKHLTQLQSGSIASIIGRYYAMDRDHRWDRTEKAYNLLTKTEVLYHFDDAITALHAAYARGETDEFVYPTSIQQQPAINDNDIVIFMNFRADRARQLSMALAGKNFSGFERQRQLHLQQFISLTEYDTADALPATVLYPPKNQKNNLSEYLSTLHYPQLHIAETEKYAHVTFFFNGGREEAYPQETRILISSPQVATYDLAPEMSAYTLTDSLVQSILEKRYRFIVCNYANPDMLGHTGNLAATTKAVEVIDECLGKIMHALHLVGGECLITADHGNAELMYDEGTQQPHTAHTLQPVPLIYVGRAATFDVNNHGALADIAPTILYLMNLAVPEEMTGRVLLQLNVTAGEPCT